MTSEQISLAESALGVLVGQPLTDMWRYGCQKFEFGEQRPAKNRKGEDITFSDWGLVVSCDWRIDGPSDFLLSSDHFGPNKERHDDHAQPFYDRLADRPLVVLTVDVLPDGSLRIELSEGFSLNVVAAQISEEWEEIWRFMPKDDSRGHLVLTGTGLDWGG